ncbi:MAG: hypothetical protein ACMUEM_07080 [Flavobacteriales bacterium AspAUS03]
MSLFTRGLNLGVDFID